MNSKSSQGSVLLSTLSFITLLSVAAITMMEMSKGTYTLTLRNEWRAQARTVAESELEYVYYQFKTKIMTAVAPDNIVAAMSGWCEDATAPTNCTLTPSSFAYRNNFTVGRSISYDQNYDKFSGTMPGTSKVGTIYYITVYVEVRPAANSPFSNLPPYRIGRRLQTFTSTIFQYGVFYQGDLEMAPGGNVTMNGDISANGSIYMGASGGGTLTLNKQVRFLASGHFNQDSSGNTVYRKPGTPTGGALTAPVFGGAGQASQLETISTPENLLGGTDAAARAVARPDLFPTENDVYRALIVPPPGQTSEYPTNATDDPVISVQRIYNRATLIVTVNADNTIEVNNSNMGAVDTANPVTSSYSGFSGAPISAPTTMYDQREGKNVTVVDIDVGALATAIGTGETTGAILYVNLKGSNSTTPAAIRLKNAAAIPNHSGNGFSVATNGGVYVKGNFNTTLNPDGSAPPAMIMGDALTLLSSAWNDANANNAALSSRVAAAGTTTINAGILTGNTSATGTTASGGVQNVVRYLEDWSGKYAVLNGSIGRLLQSNSFIAPFQQPGVVYGIPQSRSFNFDANLKTKPPPGGLSSTGFSRGDFFTW